MMDEVNFSSASSGASNTYPKQCSALRKNEYVMLRNRPCKIVEMSTSKTGKHGHAKVHLIGMCIFTNKRYEDICPSTHNMEVPNVKRTDYQCIGVEDGYVNLLSDDGTQKDDLKLPENDLGQDIKTRCENSDTFMVTVLQAMDEEQICGIKNMNP
ncbi:eukaryotic translation initiation factor 5A-1-like [Antennarius striatus]|uniref:eukaryotic translation initiation factor 5A-1-like n=1 Tax=Antennarius striatus TaxID=241820 RepID=UPI0035AE8A91